MKAKMDIDSLLSDDLELLLREINEFCGSNAARMEDEIPQPLENYLQYVAKTGNTIFPWQQVRPLFKHKLNTAIGQFHGDPSSVEPCVHERFDLFRSAPFTIQRLAELILQPQKHYKTKEKFVCALEKTVFVVSTVEPKGPEEEISNGKDEDLEDEHEHEHDETMTDVEFSSMELLGHGVDSVGDGGGDWTQTRTVMPNLDSVVTGVSVIEPKGLEEKVSNGKEDDLEDEHEHGQPMIDAEFSSIGLLGPGVDSVVGGGEGNWTQARTVMPNLDSVVDVDSTVESHGPQEEIRNDKEEDKHEHGQPISDVGEFPSLGLLDPGMDSVVGGGEGDWAQTGTVIPNLDSVVTGVSTAEPKVHEEEVRNEKEDEHEHGEPMTDAEFSSIGLLSRGVDSVLGGQGGDWEQNRTVMPNLDSVVGAGSTDEPKGLEEISTENKDEHGEPMTETEFSSIGLLGPGVDSVVGGGDGDWAQTGTIMPNLNSGVGVDSAAEPKRPEEESSHEKEDDLL